MTFHRETRHLRIDKRHGKLLLYDRYHASNWNHGPIHSSRLLDEAVAATRSTRKFNKEIHRAWDVLIEKLIKHFNAKLKVEQDGLH